MLFEKLFESEYKYTFLCITCNLENKIQCRNINDLLFFLNQYTITNIQQNEINGYCDICKNISFNKKKEMLKKTIDEIGNIQILNNKFEEKNDFYVKTIYKLNKNRSEFLTEIDKLKLENTKMEKELTELKNNTYDPNYDIFIKKFFSKLDNKLNDKGFLKAIYNDTTKPNDISWDNIDYILRHAHGFSQDKIDKMSDTEKMKWV